MNLRGRIHVQVDFYWRLDFQTRWFSTDYNKI